jgi:hypothetical protein
MPAETAHGMVFLLAARIVIAASLHNRNRSPEGLKNPLTPGFLPRPVAQIPAVVNNSD